MEMAEENIVKTTFSYGRGLWQFRVMPFRLCNAPATFKRLMERVLDGLQWRTTLVYLDDVIVYGGTFEEELRRLEEVFQRLRKVHLKLSPKKCLLFQKEMPFLGHIVGQEGVRTDPEKVAAVKEWPVPKSVTEVRSFLGPYTYYRRFVKDFANIASPLHHLTRKGARFCWDAECQSVFDDLKMALVDTPVLPYPDPSCPYIVDCDASADGKLARWLGKFEQHDYHMEHCPGRTHSNAVSLSRHPCEPGPLQQQGTEPGVQANAGERRRCGH